MSQQRSPFYISRHLLAALLALALLATTVFITTDQAWAQGNPIIGRMTIDGGGGNATGGSFSLTGTMGQPEAGALTGGDFSLTGGFWFSLALDPTGQPDKFSLVLPFVVSQHEASK